MSVAHTTPIDQQQASSPSSDAAQKQFEAELQSSMLSGATSMLTQYMMDIAGDQMSHANASE